MINEMELVKPETLGFDAKRLGRIDSAMQRFVDRGKVAGIATRVMRKGQLVQQGGYGLARIAPDKPMQPDSIFRLWSVTKAITAVAGMILYEQGHFTLNQDITEFLPEFKDTQVYVSGEGESMRLEPRQRPITVRQALTHSSGIAAGIAPDHPIEAMMMGVTQRAKEDDLILEQAVKRIAEVPLIYQPDTRWHYSHGLEIIARIVEIISGQRYDAFLREHIFEPLGMSDTGYYVRDDQLDRYTGLFDWDENGALKQVFSPEDSPEYFFRNEPDSGKMWYAGGFGLDSTPSDLARFAQMLLNGGSLDGRRILAPRTVALMTANHLPAHLLPYYFMDSPPHYGYGHGLGVHVLMNHGEAALPCHNGEYWKDGGAGTLFWVDPALDLVGIVMYQLFNFARVPVFDTFRATVYQAIEQENL